MRKQEAKGEKSAARGCRSREDTRARNRRSGRGREPGGGATAGRRVGGEERSGTGGGARETDGAEKRSLPTATGDAPKTRWTCGAISASFFFSLFFVVAVLSVCAASLCFCFFAHTNSSRAARRLRRARNAVRKTRTEADTRWEGEGEEGSRGRAGGSEPGGRGFTRASLRSLVLEMVRFFVFRFISFHCLLAFF